jgi:hypothetical protein
MELAKSYSPRDNSNLGQDFGATFIARDGCCAVGLALPNTVFARQCSPSVTLEQTFTAGIPERLDRNVEW